MKDQPCVFCGNSPINREHTWPEWLSEHFSNVEGFQGFIYSVRGNTWKGGKLLKQRVHAPCEKCNSGWMSIIEGMVEPIVVPMLNGSRPRGEVSVSEQHVLALWIAKTCMMLDLATDPPTVFTPNDYRWLAVHKEPPRATQITISAVKEPLHASSYFRALSRPIPKSAIPVETPLEAAAAAKAPDIHAPAYRLTFTLGHLVAQMFGHPTLDLDGLNYTGMIEEVMVWLWPSDRDTRPIWPPLAVLSDGEAVKTAADLPLLSIPPP